MPSTSSARRCLFPSVVAPSHPVVPAKRARVESTRKSFSCINAPPVMLPARVVTCVNRRSCDCYHFFKVLNVDTEEYEEYGREAAKYVVSIDPEAKVSVNVAGTADGLLVTLRDTVLEREAIIVVDINAIKEADSEMREISFDFEDLTHDLESAPSTLYCFRVRKDAEDLSEYALTKPSQTASCIMENCDDKSDSDCEPKAKRSRIAPKNDPVKFRDLIMVNNKLARLLFYYDPEIMTLERFENIRNLDDLYFYFIRSTTHKDYNPKVPAEICIKFDESILRNCGSRGIVSGPEPIVTLIPTEVAALFSQYFYNIFYGNYKEKSAKFVEIQNVDANSIITAVFQCVSYTYEDTFPKKMSMSAITSTLQHFDIFGFVSLFEKLREELVKFFHKWRSVFTMLEVQELATVARDNSILHTFADRICLPQVLEYITAPITLELSLEFSAIINQKIASLHSASKKRPKVI